MTININLLRKEKGFDPEIVKKSEKDRFKKETRVEKIIQLDKEYRDSLDKSSNIRKSINKLNQEIKEIYRKGEKPTTQVQEKTDLEKTLLEVEAKRDATSLKLSRKHKKIGNILTKNVPIGRDDDSNKVIRLWAPSKLGQMSLFPLLSHDKIMAKLSALETTSGTLIAGHRGYFLKGPCLLLAQALQQYALHFLVERNYLPAQPPYFMNIEYIRKTCQLSDFEESLYTLTTKTENDPNQKVLIATSEQPLSCLYAEQKIPVKDLPIRLAGISTCFRKEAGSHGKDIRGIFRVHQFEKVEQFIYTTPDKSEEELAKMVALSEEFLKSLNIPFQSVYIASGELNDAAAEKIDIEGWFPTQNKHRELMSCSNCTDYQSREVNVKYVDKNTKDFVHLLNGTLCAVQRTLCCVLENNQTEEGVKIPEVLKKYYLGKEKDIIKYDN